MKGHTGFLPSTSLDHHISMLVASRGNLSFTDPISCFRDDDCPSTVGHAVAVVRSSQSQGKPSSCNHGEEICHDPCHAKFVSLSVVPAVLFDGFRLQFVPAGLDHCLQHNLPLWA